MHRKEFTTSEIVLQTKKFRNKRFTLIFIAGCYTSKASQVTGGLSGDEALFGEVHPVSQYSQAARDALRSEQMSKPLPLGTGERTRPL